MKATGQAEAPWFERAAAAGYARISGDLMLYYQQ